MSSSDKVLTGPAAEVAGPGTIPEKEVVYLRYRTCSGSEVHAQIDGRTRHQFVPDTNRIYLPLQVKQSCSSLRERLGIADLRTYLVEALTTGSCIIVRRNAKTILVVCNKLEYVIDSEAMAICAVYER